MNANLKKLLTEVHCFLFDLDGTVYLGDRLLSGAKEVFAFLGEKGIPFYFLTNNSSKSVEEYRIKLLSLGLLIETGHIVSSGSATALYLQKKAPGSRLYVVGTPSLESELSHHGFELVQDKPDYAVLGFDTTLTYEKLRKICDFVRSGVPYIATHPDVNCPTETGFMPDIGSFIALVEASTGRRPDVIVGKPYAPIVEAIARKTGFPLSKICMVGDRIYTDIALGKVGIRTILVLSGEASAADLESSSIQPDAAAENLSEIYRALEEIV